MQRKMWLIPLLVVLFVTPLISTQGSTAVEKPLYANSFALLIGINNYQRMPKLTYAVNDVMALRDVLVKQYGFPTGNVTVLTDGQATLDGIRRALAQITSKARVGKEDRVLIYFSGHGQTVPTMDGAEKGFLIPVDAEVNLTDLTDPAPYLSTCLPMNMIWETLDLCPAKHALLIADACYSGLLARPRALATTSADFSTQVLAGMRARQVMTGGGQKQQTWEKPEWGHGAFTYKLLDELRGRAREPGKVFTAQELYVSLSRSVINLTNGKQTPQLADKDTEGEFLFVVPGVRGSTPPSTLPSTAGGTVKSVDTTATLRITTEPAGASVYLDNVEKGTTPCTLTFDLGRLKTKEMEMSLTLTGYQDAVRAVTLARGEFTPISLTMEKIAVPTVTAQPQPGTVHINPKDGAAMVYVPAGEFLMGSTDGEGSDNERPQHTVYLDAYYIYRTEVTVAQYRQFCLATGRQMPGLPTWATDDTPIITITWEDATAYALWAGAALPTEAQWEKAERGTDRRRFPWGNDWDAAKCVTNAMQNTKPVGSIPAGASPYGALDMAGNVNEWCADWYDAEYYKNSPSQNPTGPATGMRRVMRGCSWASINPDFFRAAFRSNEDPLSRSGYYGFRCVWRSPGP